MLRALLVLALSAHVADSIVADVQVRRTQCTGDPLIQFRMLQTHCEPGCVPMTSQYGLLPPRIVLLFIIFSFFVFWLFSSLPQSPFSDWR